MQTGNIIFFYTIHGSQIVGTYLEDSEDSFVIQNGDTKMAIKMKEVVRAVDTQRKSSDVKPLELKKEAPKEAPVRRPMYTSYPYRGRLHL